MEFSLRTTAPELLEPVRDAVDFFVISLFPIRKVSRSKLYLQIEKKLAASMGKSFTLAAKKSLRQNIAILSRKKSVPIKKAVDMFLGSLEKDLSSGIMSKAKLASVSSGLKAVVRMAKQDLVPAGIPSNFTMVDTRTVKVLSKHTTFWVDGFYSDQLGKRIAAVTREVMVEQGLGVKEGGKRLQRVLSRELGVTPGGKTSLASKVPARFAGRPDAYFEIVANSAAVRARSISSITSMTSAGFTIYRLTNPMDKRTSKVCETMDGREFPVPQAQKMVNKLLNASNPEDVKSISPWLSSTRVSSIAAKEGNEGLAASGVLIPPFHGKCRTEIVVASLAKAVSPPKKIWRRKKV